MRRISIASGAALLFLSGTSLAQQHQACTGPQLGTWKLQSWTGTTQVRQFKIEGKTLHIRSMPAKNPRDGKLSSSALVWTKVE